MFTYAEEPKIEILTPHKAENLLSLNTLHSQRPLRSRLVNIYATKILDGTFRTGEIAIACLAYNDHEKVLINGQHQCYAVVQADRPIKAKIERYIVNSPDELSLLYCQFDTYGTRSLADLVRVEADSLGLTWPKRLCSLLVAGAYAKEGRIGGSLPKTAKVPLLMTYREQGEFINEILNISVPNDVNKSEHCSHMMRTPVAYAMICTWEKSQSASKIFWAKVRDGEGLHRTSPEYKLRQFLVSSNYGYGRGASKFKRSVPFHEMAAKCIIAWNAFRRDLPTKLTYHPTKPIPKAL